MSMILDALSRAEQERRSENGVVLDPTRYVGSSSIKEERLKKWILWALLVNIVLVVLVLFGYLWKNNVATDVHVATEELRANDNKPSAIVIPSQQSIAPTHSKSLIQDVELAPTAAVAKNSSAQSTLNNQPSLSLQEEANVAKSVKEKISANKTIKNVVKKNPPVRYSPQPLSKPSKQELPPVAPVIPSAADQGANDYLAASNLSPAERSRLSQYVVNVHVYDNNPQNRFVLINMSKYKEGDRLPGGGPLIAAITPEGVVVDTGSGKTLLNRN